MVRRGEWIERRERGEERELRKWNEPGGGQIRKRGGERDEV